jgi:hypothetical protein
MKKAFIIGGTAVLFLDFVSYYTRIDGSILVQAGLAIAGVALLSIGLVRKRPKTWTAQVQPQPEPIYHAMPRVPQPTIDPKAKSEQILRTVPDENAFYFYKMLHYYLDVRAKNLAEFFEKLKTIDADSITFHISRGDFREWFRTTLGDDDLARQVSSLGEKDARSSGEELRANLANMVQARLTSLVRT